MRRRSARERDDTIGFPHAEVFFHYIKTILDADPELKYGALNCRRFRRIHGPFMTSYGAGTVSV